MPGASPVWTRPPGNLPGVDIDADMHYAAAPDRAFAVLANPAFQDEKCVQTGALAHEVSITTPGDRTVIDTRRSMPMDSLPDFARSFLGGRLEVHETQDWGPAGGDGSRNGRLTVEISGTPMRLGGTLALRPTADGSTVTIRSQLKANLPFIGGKAEEAAAGPIRAAIAKEEQLGGEWLAR
jgi:Protein of unknown function (DUF2505)